MLTTFFASLFANSYTKWVLGFLIVFGLCYGYYWHSQAVIEKLTQQNQILTMQNTELNKALVALKTDYDNIIKSKEELAKTISDLQKQTNQIKNTLYRENEKKKSLEVLAFKKTKLVQDLVNKATHNTMACFETLSQGGNC